MNSSSPLTSCQDMLIKTDKDKNIIVIMDNLTAHKCQLVKDIIKKYDKVKALFMPSTTPEFSPIENLFGKMKQKLRCMEFINKE